MTDIEAAPKVAPKWVEPTDPAWPEIRAIGIELFGRYVGWRLARQLWLRWEGQAP